MAESGVAVVGPTGAGSAHILSSEALAFVAGLQRHFGGRRQALLAARTERQAALDTGTRPDWLPETAHIRAGDWRVGPIPPDLMDRRVEITGPVDRKMVINALNSGANVYMADFEDAHAPGWEQTVAGQVNLYDAVRRTITFSQASNGKQYRLNDTVATLMVRPRGWHLEERHLLVDGEPVSGSLFDFGLFFFHNAHALLERGSGPYFYLPKLENHAEARLWNDVFLFAQTALGIPHGTIRATVLIENILAAFEMDEILYELREHSAGLNCGRWDYIFSVIRKFRRWPGHLLPNRVQVTMTTPFMRAYSLLLIKTCHRRGIHAMGGMAAQIPIKRDEAANEAALAKVRADKLREVTDGHDGTWVAHPGLVAIARTVFNEHMPAPNQIDRQRPDVAVSAADLLEAPAGSITLDGVRLNIDVAIRYLAAWLDGNGCVPIYDLMEDAATAEISRSQLWQWLHDSSARLSDGRPIDDALYSALRAETVTAIEAQVSAGALPAGAYRPAANLLDKLVLADDFIEFLTLPAYALLDRDLAAPLV